MPPSSHTESTNLKIITGNEIIRVQISSLIIKEIVWTLDYVFYESSILYFKRFLLL